MKTEYLMIFYLGNFTTSSLLCLSLKLFEMKHLKIVFNIPVLIKTSPSLIGICQDRRILYRF
jgi:hypothetical protein